MDPHRAHATRVTPVSAQLASGRSCVLARPAWRVGASYFCTVNVCMSVCNVGNSTINVLWKLALFCLDLVVEVE